MHILAHFFLLTAVTSVMGPWIMSGLSDPLSDVLADILIAFVFVPPFFAIYILIPSMLVAGAVLLVCDAFKPSQHHSVA